MPAAAGAMEFGAGHAQAGVGGGFHRPGQGVVEAGPAGAAFEFGAGIEKLGATTGTFEFAGAFFLIEGTGTRTLSSVLAQYAMLFRGEGTFCHGVLLSPNIGIP